MADGRLATESVDHCAKALIGVQARSQGRSFPHLIDPGTKYDTLHDAGRTEAPIFAGEHNVVGIMYFGQMVQASRLPGKSCPALLSGPLDTPPSWRKECSRYLRRYFFGPKWHG